jgi:hypothetical protein
MNMDLVSVYFIYWERGFEARILIDWLFHKVESTACYLQYIRGYLHNLNLEGSIRGCIQKFPDWVITKYTLTTINTRWEATQRIMEVKLTRLTHKIAIQLHPVTESCTICSFRSRRPVRKLLDTHSFATFYDTFAQPRAVIAQTV